MTKKERDKLYKIIEIFHNKYYEVNERNISDFYKEIHVMFPTITQNDINWAFEKYLWKKEFNLNNALYVASATMGDKNYRCKWYFAIISFNS